ncbi:mucosa-associated lymphoid tissue lymphoma translocation protein 1 isoform X2 [Callorhinchus milii]|uniref:mucosa-associated lymphoid tissue lymphoma translocation protein 1 isoform X2 n=1 Tax=Callorhinchus milii TaxID=7868 RepID=UPI0004571808|nr:mucosa-associated lymphoid tissue lymphoma translocation protein 1 isoform X2 [Callorhinchus milii]|eukprot:gi/632969783/ref/XP_007901276.1/ PREDICTED: mucosa-associated lymphoid tissue lymphoma translocation protein 1 isoform X2 [Callorhinchus milii]
MAEIPHVPSLNISHLNEPLLNKLSHLLDQSGWRKLAEMASADKRFKISSEELNNCSLKVLTPEGSPTRNFLRLMADRGMTLRDLSGYLQALDHAEAIQLFRSAVSLMIIIQPVPQAVLAGQVVRLRCQAAAHHVVEYRWFKMQVEVPNGNSSDLVLNPVTVNDTGRYICRVNIGMDFNFSQWVRLEVYNFSATYGRPFLLLDNRLQIINQPQSQHRMVGDMLVLECTAIGVPVPHYQWLRNGERVDCTERHYKVARVSPQHQGVYRCRVFNGKEDYWSTEAEVVIGPRCNVSVAVESDEDGLMLPEETSNPADIGQLDFNRRHFAATDKVALLIGNMSYHNHPKLKAPMVDVYELTNLLRQLDFKVVSLLDLTEFEMRNAVYEFLLLLDKGVYGLLYYAGHGYENYGNSFMVPINAPNPYRSAHCLCVQSILKLMQEKETGLNVFLLDMCRKRNVYDDTIPNVEALRVTANIVFGYATCQGAEAFEIQHYGLANGIFMKFLKERLLEDEKITVLLDRVAEDMGTCDLTKGKQALEIRSSLSEKRALTDPIRSSGCSVESLARNLQWAKAHELPESKWLDFECGVKIQLGFAAEFSNVMIIYTRIVGKPKEIVMCDAYVTDFPTDLDVDPKKTNRGTPEETGSYLLSKDLPEQCLYTRLSALQKLKERLVFTVCLRYQYQGLSELVEEAKEVDVGKPLIAKLDIHRGVRRNSCLVTCPMPHSPSHSPVHSPSHSPVRSMTCSPEFEHYHQHYQSHSHLGVYNNPSAGLMGAVSCAVPSEMYSHTSLGQVADCRHDREYCSNNRGINVPIEHDMNESPMGFSDQDRFYE